MKANARRGHWRRLSAPRVPRSLGGFVVALAACTAPLQAQLVRGRVVESPGERPIVLAAVTLLDSALAAVETTVSDEQGRFILEAPGPGIYLVAVDRLGYQPTVDGIELGERGFLPATIYMLPDPIALEGLTATAERRRIERVLTDAGFYDRQARGFGNFIDPDELARRKPVEMSGVLRSVPAIRSRHGDAGEQFLCNGREPRVFIDGAQIGFLELKGDRVKSHVILGQVVDPDDIAGVEVYTRPSTLPIEWAGFPILQNEPPPGTLPFDQRTRPPCTILIWTKGG